MHVVNLLNITFLKANLLNMFMNMTSKNLYEKTDERESRTRGCWINSVWEHVSMIKDIYLILSHIIYTYIPSCSVDNHFSSISVEVISKVALFQFQRFGTVLQRLKRICCIPSFSVLRLALRPRGVWIPWGTWGRHRVGLCIWWLYL